MAAFLSTFNTILLTILLLTMPTVNGLYFFRSRHHRPRTSTLTTPVYETSTTVPAQKQQFSYASLLKQPILGFPIYRLQSTRKQHRHHF
ncbi:hypothetical protein L596_026710 [Steinernema carpocapsae]|uniref:Uncharacterized protein n=1 Tax=Steinernema carpocapsae TaxID=34508 RepID=A0A4U5M343_STECR|nr:hypothetical protein L596_026710 [Steinernema carpocapsae]